MPSATRSTAIRDAVVVRLQPVRDADLIAVFLSASVGRIDAYARAARKSTRRFGGRLEPFLCGSVTLGHSRGSMPALAGFEPGRRLVTTGATYEQLALASYFAELGLAAAQPEHADSQLHAWLLTALSAANAADQDDLPWFKLAGDVTWLAATGSLPNPLTCADCRDPIAQAARWTPVTGGPVCHRCAAPAPLNVALSLLVGVDSMTNGRVDIDVVRGLRGLAGGPLEIAIGAQVAGILPGATRSLRDLPQQFSLAQ